MSRVEASTPVLMPGAVQSAGRGRPRVAEGVVGVLIVLVVLVGGALLLARQQVDQILGQVQSAIPTAYTPAQPTVNVPAEEYQASVGEAVPLQDGSGNDLGDVTVLEGKKYSKVGDYLTADPGRVFVGARVRYVARSEFSYNLFDWVAHDDKGTQYEPSGYALSPELGSGTLAAGRKVEGWVSFDVPKTTGHIWVDYQTYDGTVIFSVSLF